MNIRPTPDIRAADACLDMQVLTVDVMREIAGLPETPTIRAWSARIKALGLRLGTAFAVVQPGLEHLRSQSLAGAA